MLINVFYQLVIGLIYPSLPLFMKLAGLSIITISIILSSISILSFIFSIIIGYFYDKTKSKRSMLIIMGGTGVFILSLISAFPRLYYMLPLLGVSISALYPMIMVSASEGEEVEKKLGFFWAGGSIGWAIGTGLTGFLLKYLGIFYIYVIATGFYVVMVYISVKSHSEEKRGGKNTSQSVKVSPLLFIFSFFAIFILFSIDTIKNLYLPTYYVFDLGVSVPLATLTLSVESLLEIPSILFFTQLISKKVRDTEVFALSFVLTSFYLLLNYLAFNTITAFMAMSFYCLVWGSFIVSSSVIVATVSEKFRGLGFGIFNALYPLAGIVTPLYVGILIKSLGYRHTILYLSFLPLIIGISYYLIQSKYRIERA